MGSREKSASRFFHISRNISATALIRTFFKKIAKNDVKSQPCNHGKVEQETKCKKCNFGVIYHSRLFTSSLNTLLDSWQRVSIAAHSVIQCTTARRPLVVGQMEKSASLKSIKAFFLHTKLFLLNSLHSCNKFRFVEQTVERLIEIGAWANRQGYRHFSVDPRRD